MYKKPRKFTSKTAMAEVKKIKGIVDTLENKRLLWSADCTEISTDKSPVKE